MSMRDEVDPATALGAVFGVFVAAVGVATLVGMPWQHLAGGALLAVFRVAGALLAVVVGAALVRLALA